MASAALWWDYGVLTHPRPGWNDLCRSKSGTVEHHAGRQKELGAMELTTWWNQRR